MDLEQLEKRLDWLESERRKDKTIIATLEERIGSYEGDLPALRQQIKELNSEVIRLTAMLSKFDQLDAAVQQVRIDLTRSVETLDKTRQER